MRGGVPLPGEDAQQTDPQAAVEAHGGEPMPNVGQALEELPDYLLFVLLAALAELGLQVLQDLLPFLFPGRRPDVNQKVGVGQGLAAGGGQVPGKRFALGNAGDRLLVVPQEQMFAADVKELAEVLALAGGHAVGLGERPF